MIEKESQNSSQNQSPNGLRESSSSSSSSNGELVFVTWDDNDPLNPVNWSTKYKYYMTTMAVLMSFFAATCAGIYGQGEHQMMKEFGVSREITILGISVFPLGYGIGPLILAPLSELWGRNSVYFVSYFVFIILFLPQALAKNITTVIVSRFLAGLAASTSATMVGGTIADMFRTENRGPPMALFGAMTMSGTGFGPLIGGFIVENPNMGFRWLSWIQMILNGSLYILLLITFKETRNSIVLKSKAQKLRKETGNQNIVAPIEVEHTQILELMRVSLFRPIKFLFTEPIVFFFALWISFTWGILYLFLKSVGQVFSASHGFGPSQVGLTFLGVIVGGIIGALTNPLQEYYVAKSSIRNGGKHQPESRLIMSAIAGILFCAGLFLFGWTSGPQHPWIAPVIGMTMVAFAIHAIYTAVFNYLADCYSIYASSALAGQSFARNMFGCAFPLFSEQMNSRLGFQWSMSLLGFLGIILTTTPFILIWKGPQIRARSKVSMKLIEMQPDDTREGDMEFEEEIIGHVSPNR